jgi:hypothetical protein
MMGMTQAAVLLKNIGPNPDPEISKKPNQDKADLKPQNWQIKHPLA